MSKWLKNNKELLFTLLFAYLAGFSAMMFKQFRGLTVESGLFFAAFIIFLIVAVYWLKRLLMNKLFPKVNELFIGLKGRIHRAINYIIRKLGIKRRGSFIRGRDKIEFGIFDDSDEQQKRRIARFKLGKYEDCENCEQRVRYIYTGFLLKKHKKGYTISHSKTPSGIAAETAVTDGEKDIFSLYQDVRYGSSEADSERVGKAYNEIK